LGSSPSTARCWPEQLDALAKLVPTLSGYRPFVFAKMRKLAPSADADVEFDDAEREAWLERLWAYVKTLPPAFNTEKSHVLYMRLDHDRKKGVYDAARFPEYLKFPRSYGYVNPKWIEAQRDRQPVSDLNADLAEALPHHRPIGNDEALVRDDFLHSFQRAAAAHLGDIGLEMMKPYTEYVRDTWLKPILAEALITSVQNNAEQWASLITPAEFQRLKDRVDIEIPSTNGPLFKPAQGVAPGAQAGDDVQFEVVVKNTPKLIVKIYEVNAENFFLTQRRQLNTDLNLDGLIANSEQTHTFDTGPFKRTRQTFKFPALTGKRGARIVEFIGGGRSSRVLLRIGQWQVLQNTGPSGDLLTVLDENGEQVKDAVAWLDGRKLTCDGKLGRIVVPFTQQPGMKPIVLADAEGTFATLAQFAHHTEAYVLVAQFHIEREQLLARREATLAVRTALMLGEAHLDPSLLTEAKLTVTSVTHDGISTTREFKDLKLTAGGVLTHDISVPERLAQLTVTLTGKVDILTAGGQKRDVSASHHWTLNGIEKTDGTNDGHLPKFRSNFVFELLARNGEPLADQQAVFVFKHCEFARTQSVALRTLAQKAGEMAGTTGGANPSSLRRAMNEPMEKKQAAPGGAAAGSNLDFLAASAPAIYNFLPDKDGFYFPATAKDGAKFPHYPVNVAVTGTSAATAKAFEFHVVAKLTQLDKASWDYVSQYGTDAEVFAFIEQNNIESLNLERIAWRARQSVDFFRKLEGLM